MPEYTIVTYTAWSDMYKACNQRLLGAMVEKADTAAANDVYGTCLIYH